MTPDNRPPQMGTCDSRWHFYDGLHEKSDICKDWKPRPVAPETKARPDVYRFCKHGYNFCTLCEYAAPAPVVPAPTQQVLCDKRRFTPHTLHDHIVGGCSNPRTYEPEGAAPAVAPTSQLDGDCAGCTRDPNTCFRSGFCDWPKCSKARAGTAETPTPLDHVFADRFNAEWTPEKERELLKKGAETPTGQPDCDCGAGNDAYLACHADKCSLKKFASPKYVAGDAVPRTPPDAKCGHKHNDKVQVLEPDDWHQCELAVGHAGPHEDEKMLWWEEGQIDLRKQAADWLQAHGLEFYISHWAPKFAAYASSVTAHKDAEIKILRQRIDALIRTNTELKAELERRDKEIAELKKRLEESETRMRAISGTSSLAP